jgi:hypothetical protein
MISILISCEPSELSILKVSIAGASGKYELSQKKKFIAIYAINEPDGEDRASDIQKQDNPKAINPSKFDQFGKESEPLSRSAINGIILDMHIEGQTNEEISVALNAHEYYCGSEAAEARIRKIRKGSI